MFCETILGENMRKKFFINSIILILSTLIASNSNDFRKYNQYNESVKSVKQTQFPVNDPYKVRSKVIETQNQYQKSREAQYKQIKSYENYMR